MEAQWEEDAFPTVFTKQFNAANKVNGSLRDALRCVAPRMCVGEGGGVLDVIVLILS